MKSKHIRYDCSQYKEWMREINKRTNGNYYTDLWHGFLNYYDRETNERVGYDAMQGGFYLIDKEHEDDE